MKGVFQVGSTGARVSIYLPSKIINEICEAADMMGTSVSKLIQDAWVVAREYKGAHVAGTMFPLPPRVEHIKENSAKTHKEKG